MNSLNMQVSVLYSPSIPCFLSLPQASSCSLSCLLSPRLLLLPSFHPTPSLISEPAPPLPSLLAVHLLRLSTDSEWTSLGGDHDQMKPFQPLGLTLSVPSDPRPDPFSPRPWLRLSVLTVRLQWSPRDERSYRLSNVKSGHLRPQLTQLSGQKCMSVCQFPDTHVHTHTHTRKHTHTPHTHTQRLRGSTSHLSVALAWIKRTKCV